MPLTTQQRTDFQGDLGIGSDQTVFTNDELDRLYERAGEAYNLAVYLGYRQLYAASGKYFDYKVAQTEEKRSQLRQALKEMVEFWAGESRVAGNQLRMLGLAGVPDKWKDEPNTLVQERRRQQYPRRCR